MTCYLDYAVQCYKLFYFVRDMIDNIYIINCQLKYSKVDTMIKIYFHYLDTKIVFTWLGRGGTNNGIWFVRHREKQESKEM